MAPLLPLLPGVCGGAAGAAITGAVAMARPGVAMGDCSMTWAEEKNLGFHGDFYVGFMGIEG